MGFLTNFWNGVKKAFGIKPKEEKNVPPEVPKITGIETVQPGEIKQEIKPEQERKYTNYLNRQEEKPIQVTLPQLPPVSPDIKKKYQTFFKRFEQVTSVEMSDWADAINPSKVVINTGFYGSHNDLNKSKYDIYRNIILANIKDDSLIQKIYQSGLINEHIVGVIRVRIIYKSKGRAVNVSDATLEVQGLTPDIALRTNLHDELIGKYPDGYQAVKQKVQDLTGLKVQQFETTSASEVEVIHVQIGFNYA